MSLPDRIEEAVVVEREVYDIIRHHPAIANATINGSECTHDPGFMNEVRRSTAPAALLLRYQPDGVALTKKGGVFYWDAKASDQIEKQAYQIYMKLSDWGCPVWIWCRPPGCDLYYQRLHLIRFQDSTQWVNGFPDPWPVYDDWIYPPGSDTAYSGTPYRVIDLSSMRNWYEEHPRNIFTPGANTC